MYTRYTLYIHSNTPLNTLQTPSKHPIYTTVQVGLRLLAHDVLNTWARRIAVMSLERMGDEWVGLCLFQLVEALRCVFVK